MNTNENSLHSRYRWLKRPFSSGGYHTWLIDDGSLTARLQHRYHQFSVKPLTIKYAKPLAGEAVLLHMPIDRTALVRDVLLFGNAAPVVFAHSILPRASLRGLWRGLGRLGNQPLGATLFANPKVKRTPLSYKKLSSNHALYRHAAKHLSEKPPYLWARRSVFSLNCANIMVTEVFLPDITP